MEIRRIVFTGTDVSGKTKAWRTLRDELAEQVTAVPEAASILIGELGVQPPFFGDRLLRFQQAIAGKIRVLEDASSYASGKTLETVTLLCDRGLADGVAYLGSDEAFEAAIGMPAAEARGRYAAVLLFYPPAEEVFVRSRADNPGRVQRTYEEVLGIHDATLRAWGEHPALFHVPSFSTWEEKLAVARGHLLHVLTGLSAD